LSNEHIARLQKIGLGKESTSGTAVAVSTWIPKSKGIVVPMIKDEYDTAAYGVIDKNRQAFTIEKWTEFTIDQSEPRDVWIGHFLMAAYGSSWPCVKFPIPGSITGTYVEGETITQSVTSATGTLRRLDAGGTSKCLYVEPVSGTFTTGNTLTGGTSGATSTGGTIESPAAIRHHVFRKLNTNNPPAYTIYGQDPVTGDERASYCVCDTLDFEAQADALVKFSSKFMGQPLASTTTQTPVYTNENPFLGKNLSVKFASVFNSLDAATATAMKRLKTQIKKNVEMVHQTGGTDPLAPTSLHNGEFEHLGDFSLLYNSTALRDLALPGTAQAMRATVANTAVTIGSAANPMLQFDFPEVYFNSWGKDSDNAKIVFQNLSFTAAYNVGRALTSEAILVNTQVTAY
jgi:hypothetical protein